MGLCLSKEDVERSPVKAVKPKSEEVKDTNGDVLIEIVEDPFLKYGGSYAGDPKDTADFKYVKFTEVPKLTPAHKSAMAKYLTPELFEKLKAVESSKGYTLSNAIMTGEIDIVEECLLHNKYFLFHEIYFFRGCDAPSWSRRDSWR